jgi:glycosyltransferase involved in cell wall biosynthesis
MISIVIISILITHAAIVGSWLRDFLRLGLKIGGNARSERESLRIEPLTVVIACKNEALRLPNLIGVLKMQVEAAVEIVIVDDNSTDSTLDVARKLSESDKIKISAIQNKGKGKKAAIRTGIQHSQTRWVITTDADVICPDKWLECMGRTISKYDDGNLGAIAGPVRIMNGGIEGIEYAAMMGWAAASSINGKTSMASAANLAFRVDLYPDEDKMHTEIESGDDVFAIHALIGAGNTVYWSHDFNSCVDTQKAGGVVNWLVQRVRWGSKAKYYTHSSALRTSIWIAFLAITQIFILTLFIAGFVSLTELMTLWFGRAIIDIVFTRIVTKWYRIKTGVIDWLILSIIYPIQVPVVFIFGLINKPKWK